MPTDREHSNASALKPWTQSARLQQTAWLGAALLVSALFALSTATVIAYRGDYFTISGESAAYRFFFVDRLVHEEPSHLYLPQGYFTSLLHRLVYSLVVPENGDLSRQLRDVVNQWGRVSSITVCLLVGGLITVGFTTRTLPALAKVGIAVAALGPSFCTTSVGFYYSAFPDYYFVNMALAPLITTVFLWLHWRSEVSVSMLIVAGLGVLVGIAASNKISMLPLAALPLALVAARDVSRPRVVLTAALVAGSAAVGSFVLVHLLLYGFNATMLMSILPLWLQFVFNPGEEPQFWNQFFQVFLLAYNYVYIFAALILLLVVTAITIYLGKSRGKHRRESWLIFSAIVGVALFLMYAVVKRPAGSTAFEGATISFALIGCLIGFRTQHRLHTSASWMLVIAFVVLALTTYQYKAATTALTQSNARAEAIWEWHASLVALGKPVVVVIPDNSYGFGSVEEALLKGFAAFPTWTVREGQAGLDRYAPGMTFRVEGGNPGPSAPYPPGATIAYFERTDRTPLPDRYAGLKDALAGTQRTCVRIQFSEVNVAATCQAEP